MNYKEIEKLAIEYVNSPHYDDFGHKGSFIAGYKAALQNKVSEVNECYFMTDKKGTSLTICVNCGKEKSLHTIGEGITASKVICQTADPSTEQSTSNWKTVGDKDKFLDEVRGKDVSADENKIEDDLIIRIVSQWGNAMVSRGDMIKWLKEYASIKNKESDVINEDLEGLAEYTLREIEDHSILCKDEIEENIFCQGFFCGYKKAERKDSVGSTIKMIDELLLSKAKELNLYVDFSDREYGGDKEAPMDRIGLLDYLVNKRKDNSLEKSHIEGVLLGLKICKEIWAQGIASHENIYENEVLYKEKLKNIESQLQNSSVGVSDAIEFAEWLFGEGYTQYDGKERWINFHNDNHVYSTKELYKIFQESQPQQKEV